MALYTALVIPYIFAFPPETTEWFKTEISIDIFFTMDLIKTFLTAYETKDHYIEVRFKQIALNYIFRGSFVCDFICWIPFYLFEFVLPVDEFGHEYDMIMRIVRIIKVLRLFKVLEISKVAQILKKLKYIPKYLRTLNPNMGTKKLLKGATLTILLAHFASCIWFFSARLDNFKPDTWVVRKEIVDEHPWYQYLF